MNTIDTYISNIFSTVPKTDEIERLKENLLADMQEKYKELKEKGKSEQEAISTVISEFGNIEELLEEFNINTEDAEPKIEKQEVINYLNKSKKSFKRIGYAVGLTLTGLGISYLLYQLIKDNFIFNSTNNMFYLVPFASLILFIAPSIYLFISEGLNINKISEIKNNKGKVNKDALIYLSKESDLFKAKFAKGIVTGIVLVLISPISFFLLKSNNSASMALGILISLLLISTAVTIFITVGTYYSDLEFFKETKNHIAANPEVERILGAVAAFIFPITFVICIFIFLYFQKWILAIAVFFAISMIYSAFAGSYSTIKSK